MGGLASGQSTRFKRSGKAQPIGVFVEARSGGTTGESGRVILRVFALSRDSRLSEKFPGSRGGVFHGHLWTGKRNGKRQFITPLKRWSAKQLTNFFGETPHRSPADEMGFTLKVVCRRCARGSKKVFSLLKAFKGKKKVSLCIKGSQVIAYLLRGEGSWVQLD